MNIIGHSNILDYFRKVIDNQKLSHCYLFAGPEHIGKRTVLAELIKELIGRPDLEVDLHKPNELRQRHPDFFYLQAEDGDKEITVDQARALKREMSLGSFVGKRIITVIYGAERLNQSSANALLKLLEEPNRQAIIFLLASHRQAVMPTILSRSVVVDFKQVKNGEIEEALKKLGAAPELADLIARFSLGRPGLSFEYFGNQEKFDTILKQYQDVLAALGQPLYRRFGLLAATDSEQLSDFSSVLQLVLRDIMQAKVGKTDLIINQRAVSELKAMAGRLEAHNLADELVKLDAASEDQVFNINLRLNLEHILQSL